MAHATHQGLTWTALFFTPEDLPLAQRENFESIAIDKMISHHIMRVSAVLLCTLTDIQAHFRFDDARINQRIHEIWKVLIPAMEIRELYDDRYQALMESKGIYP